MFLRIRCSKLSKSVGRGLVHMSPTVSRASTMQENLVAKRPPPWHTIENEQ